MKKYPFFLSTILVYCFFFSSCKTTNKNSIIGGWNYTKGDKHVWPEKIIFLPNGQMKSCENDHILVSKFNVINEREINLFLPSKELKNGPKTWTPYVYYNREGKLFLCTPDGNEGVYSRIPDNN